MKLLLLALALALSSCAQPITLTGAYEDPDGRRFEGGATFTLPSKAGYAK